MATVEQGKVHTGYGRLSCGPITAVSQDLAAKVWGLFGSVAKILPAPDSATALSIAAELTAAAEKAHRRHEDGVLLGFVLTLRVVAAGQSESDQVMNFTNAALSP